MCKNLRKTVNVWFLGLIAYKPALHIQQYLAARHVENIGRANFANSPNLDTLLIVEHPPVYTIGIRRDDYPLTEEIRLKAFGADFCRTNRGGLITYHGPGQLVAYPILNLSNFNKSMKWYICKLEETVIQLCRTFGIEAERSADTGVWIKDNKLCSIGVHGSRYITTHGLALNCNTDLNWFSHIVPCGIKDKGVTSLSETLNRKITVETIIDPFLNAFSEQFKCEFTVLPYHVKTKTVSHLKQQGLITSHKTEMQLLQERLL